MEAELEGFLHKLRTEGVEEGQRQAIALREKVQQELDELKTKTKKELKEHERTVLEELAVQQQRSIDLIQRAFRDNVIALKQRIEEIFCLALEKKVQGELEDPAFLSSLIEKVSTTLGPSQARTIFISQEESQALFESVKKNLQGKFKESTEIQMIPGIEGIRIQEKGQDFYVEISNEVVTQMLMHYLSEPLKKILKNRSE